MLKKVALVFPGQGSQKLGSLARYAESKRVRDTFDEASEALGYNLWSLLQEGPEEQLNQTQYTQPVLLTAALALFWHWRDIREDAAELQFSVFAGHSLGEYSALVAAESLSLTEAVRLVALRGSLMQAAVPVGQGAMAAILGLEDEAVQALCESISQEIGLVSPVNYNCPLQVVVAGLSSAVQQAMVAAKAAGGKAILLPMSVPSHCALMKPAAEQLKAALEAIHFKTPKIPILHNVDLCEHREEPEIREALVRQLYNPVRWKETIQKMEHLGVHCIFETGPGSVLTGLNRRISSTLDCRVLPEEEALCS